MVSFGRMAAFAGILLLIQGRGLWAGYDFGPAGLRSAARYVGIGPGPGYHGVPCRWYLDRFQSRVTDNYAPYPVEPDYRPSLYHEQAQWLPSSAPDVMVSAPVVPDDFLANPRTGTGESIRLVPAERPPIATAPAPKEQAPRRRSSDPLLHQPHSGPGDDRETLFHRLQPPEASDPNAASSPATAARFGSNWW